MRRAFKVVHIDAVQVEYSPFALVRPRGLRTQPQQALTFRHHLQEIETPDIDLLKTCRELGVAVVAYSPLGRGFVTGQYKSPDDFEEGDFRKFAPRFSPENFPKNLKLVDELVELAKKKGCTPGQLTLAWLLAQGDDIFPIPGTKKIKYLEENWGALQIKLSAEEEKEIRKAVEGAEIHGGRYPEAFKGHLYADTPPLES